MNEFYVPPEEQPVLKRPDYIPKKPPGRYMLRAEIRVANAHIELLKEALRVREELEKEV